MTIAALLVRYAAIPLLLAALLAIVGQPPLQRPGVLALGVFAMLLAAASEWMLGRERAAQESTQQQILTAGQQRQTETILQDLTHLRALVAAQEQSQTTLASVLSAVREASADAAQRHEQQLGALDAMVTTMAAMASREASEAALRERLAADFRAAAAATQEQAEAAVRLVRQVPAEVAAALRPAREHLDHELGEYRAILADQRRGMEAANQELEQLWSKLLQRVPT